MNLSDNIIRLVSLNKVLKYLLLGVTIVLCNLISFGQSIDSLKLALKKAKHDTTRCNVLSLLAETASDSEWPVFNEQLKTLSEKKAAEGGKLKMVYLKYLAGALNNIGFLADMQGNTSKALESHDKSLKINAELGNKSGMASTFTNLGNLYFKLGDLSKTLEYYNRSLNIWEEIRDTVGIARSLQYIGLIYERQGDIIRAIENFHRSLKLYEKIRDNKGISSCFQSIGSVYYYQEDIAQALGYYEKSLKIQRQIGDRDGTALSLNNIALIYYDQDKFPLALDYHQQSLKIREEMGNKLAMAISLSNIGNIYAKQGDKIMALEYLHKSLQLQEEIGDKRGLAWSFVNIAIQLINSGKVNDAYVYANKGMQTAKELGYPLIIKNAAHTLKTIFQKQKKYKEAFEMYSLEVSMNDSISSEKIEKATVKKQMQYTYEKKEAVAQIENKAELEKQQAVADEKQRKQIIVIWSVVLGLILVIGFSAYVFKTLRVTRKQKMVIEIKSKEVEEKQTEILDSIYYARRIQMAQLPSDKYITKSLNKLKAKG